MPYRYDQPDNLVTLLEDSTAQFSQNPLFGTKTEQGVYEWVTYKEVGRRVDDLRGGLIQKGIGKGDAVGIIAPNCAEWAVAAFATFGIGGRFIPMYEQELASTWQYIINDGGIKLLFVPSKAVYEQVQGFMEQTPSLKSVVIFQGEGDQTMAALERLGAANPVPAIRPSTHDIAVLIYTSGTTGNPKGVLLSHGNFSTNFQAGGSLYRDLLGPDARSLSILPWAHSYGQTAELYNFIWYGASIGFMGSMDTLAEDLEKVRPTLLIAVPKLFNKIHDGLKVKVEEQGGLAKKLFDMGINSAQRRRQMAEKGVSETGTNLKYALADKIVFKKIRQKFGGHLQGALTASATMNVEIGHFFADIGIPVYDCYGLTETSPAVTMNCPEAHKPGSVGRPIDQVTVRIEKLPLEPEAEDGEVIVYGPNVMQGYHNNPEATAAVMTEDGGLRTGDRGRLDRDGYLFITGRLKEQYKLANGKYVFPAILEEEIKLCPWVENAMIYGEGREFNVCLVKPDFEVLEKYARRHDVTPDGAALTRDAGIQKMLAAEIERFLKGKFGGYEIPRRFIWLTENFSLENGMLTQTMKLKRRTVLKQYGTQIETLYTTE